MGQAYFLSRPEFVESCKIHIFITGLHFIIMLAHHTCRVVIKRKRVSSPKNVLFFWKAVSVKQPPLIYFRWNLHKCLFFHSRIPFFKINLSHHHFQFSFFCASSSCWCKYCWLFDFIIWFISSFWSISQGHSLVEIKVSSFRRCFYAQVKSFSSSLFPLRRCRFKVSNSYHYSFLSFLQWS